MPTSPPRLCPTVGCPGLWDGQRCTVCDRKPRTTGWQPDKLRGSRHERGYDHQWVKLRAAYLARNPCCVQCEAEGRTVPATDVHHKQPFKGKRDPLRLDWENLESLCKQHHAAVGAADSKGGGG